MFSTSLIEIRFDGSFGNCLFKLYLHTYITVCIQEFLRIRHHCEIGSSNDAESPEWEENRCLATYFAEVLMCFSFCKVLRSRK